MAGKYSKLSKKLEPLRPEESYQQRVVREKNLILTRCAACSEPREDHETGLAACTAYVPRQHTSAGFATRWAELRAEKAALEQQLKDVELGLEAHAQLMSDAYDAEGVARVVLADGQSIGRGEEPHAVIVDPHVFRRWCIEQDLGNLMSIPWQTANTLVKERLIAGQNEPPGVKAYMRTKFSLRKGSSQEEG
jgi:hypothetical protein